jgi:hypothetical protein
VYTGTVTVPPSGEIEPEDYQGVVGDNLNAKRTTLTKRLAAKKARTTAGWISLVTGLVGAGEAGVTYFLGSLAYSSYQNATTTSDADSARTQTETYGILWPIGAGVCLAGAAVSAILFLVPPDTNTLQKSLKRLDEQIAQFHSHESADATP